MNYPYWVALGLFMLGLYTMIVHKNYFKKFIGLTILQSSIILFFLITSVKRGGTIPIVHHAGTPADTLMNPLPHALMLTAIVVAVATAGVAFAILIRLHERYRSLEEDVIAARILADPSESS